MYKIYITFRRILVFAGVLFAPYIFFQLICSTTFKMAQEDSNILAGFIWIVYIFFCIEEYSDEIERVKRTVRNKCRVDYFDT